MPESQQPEPTSLRRPGVIRRVALPVTGVAAMLGGLGYAGNVYREVNVPTVTAEGDRMGILDAAQDYLGPDGNEARCADAKLAEVSERVAAIPDDRARELLDSRALDLQAKQFNSLGANNVTAEDLYYLLTHTPQTPDTQCDRPGGTSTSELLREAPYGVVVAIIGSIIIACTAGAARARRRLAEITR